MAAYVYYTCYSHGVARLKSARCNVSTLHQCTSIRSTRQQHTQQPKVARAGIACQRCHKLLDAHCSTGRLVSTRPATKFCCWFPLQHVELAANPAARKTGTRKKQHRCLVPVKAQRTRAHIGRSARCVVRTASNARSQSARRGAPGSLKSRSVAVTPWGGFLAVTLRHGNCRSGNGVGI